MVARASWTAHKTPEGRTYYYDRTSARSTWDRPADFGDARHVRPSLERCIDESPFVAGLFNAMLKHCKGVIPSVSSLAPEHTLCQGGRGGAFCCASNRIYICQHTWVGCREVAYELSHMLNVCRGTVNCTKKGMEMDGVDCGYLAAPDVACSECARPLPVPMLVCHPLDSLRRARAG
jgi:hypothetical protein